MRNLGTRIQRSPDPCFLLLSKQELLIQYRFSAAFTNNAFQRQIKRHRLCDTGSNIPFVGEITYKTTTCFSLQQQQRGVSLKIKCGHVCLRMVQASKGQKGPVECLLAKIREGKDSFRKHYRSQNATDSRGSQYCCRWNARTGTPENNFRKLGLKWSTNRAQSTTLW